MLSSMREVAQAFNQSYRLQMFNLWKKLLKEGAEQSDHKGCLGWIELIHSLNEWSCIIRQSQIFSPDYFLSTPASLHVWIPICLLPVNRSSAASPLEAQVLHASPLLCLIGTTCYQRKIYSLLPFCWSTIFFVTAPETNTCRNTNRQTAICIIGVCQEVVFRVCLGFTWLAYPDL